MADDKQILLEAGVEWNWDLRANRASAAKHQCLYVCLLVYIEKKNTYLTDFHRQSQ